LQTLRRFTLSVMRLVCTIEHGATVHHLLAHHLIERICCHSIRPQVAHPGMREARLRGQLERTALTAAQVIQQIVRRIDIRPAVAQLPEPHELAHPIEREPHGKYKRLANAKPSRATDSIMATFMPSSSSIVRMRPSGTASGKSRLFAWSTTPTGGPPNGRNTAHRLPRYA